MLLSEMFAIGSAVCIALSSMFISELHGRVPLFRLARWQLTASFIATARVATALGGWATLGSTQVSYLVASSFFGIVIASTTYFAAIYTAGPRVTALLFSLTSPFALIAGYFAFGETISLGQAAGVALILGGLTIAISLRRRPPPPSMQPTATPAEQPPLSGPSLLGIALGVITAIGQALGSLLARPAMATGVEPFTAMAVRAGFAVLVFWALLVLPFVRAEKSTFRMGDLGLAVTSSFFGTTLGMSLLMAALAGGNVGLVSTLSSMTPVVVLPMVWLRTGIRPNVFAWIGATLAIIGTGLISFA